MNYVFFVCSFEKAGNYSTTCCYPLSPPSALPNSCMAFCKSAVTWCKCFIALGIHSQSSIKEVFTFLQIKKQKIPNKLGLKVTLTEECQSNYFLVTLKY